MASSYLPRLAILSAALGFATLIGMAQPPKEKEDPKGQVKKKIVVEDEDPKGTVKKKIDVDDPAAGKKDKGGAGTNAPDVRLDELVRAAAETADPDLKRLFTKYAVPFDRLTELGGSVSIKPIPYRRSEWPAGQEAVKVEPLDANGKPRAARAAHVKDIRGIDHYEALIVADVETLLKSKSGASAQEYLAASEKLLAAASRFHEYARERNVRKGKAWDELRTAVTGRLRSVRLDLLRASQAANDTLAVREIGTRLMNAYPKDAEVAQAVAVARIGEAARLAQSANNIDQVRAKELLDELESRFPGAGGEPGRKVRATLHEIAQKAFTRAREKKAVGDLTTARDELARAAALDPSIDGLREMQRELRSGYPILYVGVRQVPKNLSPATARLDSEKQAVELMFEGLLEEVPEESGAVSYRPGAAIAMPTATPGGRDFALRVFERDASARPGFDSHDMVGTVRMLRTHADSWGSYPLAWLDDEPPTPKDAGSVRLRFKQAHPDPRATLTFKLLPTRWLDDNSKLIDDAGFAEKPFGTGPFKYHGTTNPDASVPREVIFVDNPGYGRWRDRTGLPYLREIRMIEVAKLDPAAAFLEDKLHILPDVPTADLDKYTAPGSGLAGKVQVVTARSNRRVHVLAVNLARPYLQSKLLRQGLSMAIDRDDILREVFRAGRVDFHKPMTGPYPPGSWAGGKGPGSDRALLNRDLAVSKLKSYFAGSEAKTEFTLSYPDDDPGAAAACAKIKSHIESLTREMQRKIIINLDAVPYRELMVRVRDEHRYDLAYVPFDYPDDWHPFALGAALDPAAAGRDGRNWFSFLVRDTAPDEDDQRLGRLLNDIRLHRDPSMLATRAAEAARLFNDSLPFIPLWQLDRHTVVSNSLKVFVDDTANPVNPRVLNPTTLFQGIARWRLD